jgi:cystathionine beta-lyase
LNFHPNDAPGGPQAETLSGFDEIIDRSDSNSVKWAFGDKFLSSEERAANPIPMWVADMDFRAPPPVIEALGRVLEHGVLGYPGGPTPNYIDAVTDWQARRFGWDVSREWLLAAPGVITSLKTAIQAFSSPGDSILIQPPVYSHFHSDVLLNGRQLAVAPLELTERGYVFDEFRFEAAISGNTKMFILCNPHNPTGNVWSKDELAIMGEICQRRGVLVVSDEIHEDFIMNTNCVHTPFASLGERFAQNSITCTSPTKTFNLAGLQNANLFVPNWRLREELGRQLNRNILNNLNLMGLVAAEAAYRYCEQWLEDLLKYLRANHALFAERINKIAQGRIRVFPADSLYLAWMDCRGLSADPDELRHFMLVRAGVWLDDGRKYGLQGEGFMRANLGCPRSRVEEAAQRIGNSLRRC